jgi:hypothetical protein
LQNKTKFDHETPPLRTDFSTSVENKKNPCSSKNSKIHIQRIRQRFRSASDHGRDDTPGHGKKQGESSVFGCRKRRLTAVGGVWLHRGRIGRETPGEGLCLKE